MIMKSMNLSGKWVLVTGASSGLGAEMARQLATLYGARLILVARRKDRLEALAQELRLGHGTEVLTLAADLSDTSEVDRVVSEVQKHCSLYAAILNAGATHFGHHDELGWDGFQRMLQLNVQGTVRFLHLLLPLLEQSREQGGVLVVASLAGLTPVAYQSAYSGTKGFLVNYACSLHHEMRTRGVSITTFCPGGIATEMTQGERFNDLRSWLVPVGPCARTAIEGLRKRKYLVVPGLIYRWGSFATRLLPQSFVVGQVATQYRRSLSKNSAPAGDLSARRERRPPPPSTSAQSDAGAKRLSPRSHETRRRS